MPIEYQNLEDNVLAQMTQAGEYEAFSEIGRRYTGLIRYKVGQFLDISISEKEDLAQEGFVGLFAAAKTFRSDKNTLFKTYASVCIENCLIRAARRYASQKNAAQHTCFSVASSEEVTEAAAVSPEGNPQAVVEMKESFRQFEQQIRERLTKLEYRALVLHFSGAKRAHIMKEAGMTLKTYDNALHRVRRKLKNFSDRHSA